MLDISAYNVYVIFTDADPLFRRRLFLEELGNPLVSAAILRRDSVSCRCPSRHKSTDTSNSGVKRGTCKWCTGQKKEQSALASVVVDTLAKSVK